MTWDAHLSNIDGDMVEIICVEKNHRGWCFCSFKIFNWVYGGFLKCRYPKSSKSLDRFSNESRVFFFSPPFQETPISQNRGPTKPLLKYLLQWELRCGISNFFRPSRPHNRNPKMWFGSPTVQLDPNHLVFFTKSRITWILWGPQNLALVGNRVPDGTGWYSEFQWIIIICPIEKARTWW